MCQKGKKGELKKSEEDVQIQKGISQKKEEAAKNGTVFAGEVKR